MANRKMDENVHWVDFPKHTGNGGGGGGSDMLEPRVAKLEAIAEHIASDVTDIKSDGKTMLSDLSSLKTDVALIRRDGDDLRSDSSASRADVASITKRLDEVEKTLSSLTITFKVGCGVLSAAIAVFGYLAGPYLTKIASILNGLAIQN